MHKIYSLILICLLLVSCTSNKTTVHASNTIYNVKMDSLELFDKSRNRIIPVALYYPNIAKKTA